MDFRATLSAIAAGRHGGDGTQTGGVTGVCISRIRVHAKSYGSIMNARDRINATLHGRCDLAMTAFAATLLTFFVSYLIGAIPFGFLVARWRGVNIFQCGSGNIGATNVGRILGKRFGVLVFFLDFAKGAFPVALAPWVGQRFDSDVPSE